MSPDARGTSSPLETAGAGSRDPLREMLRGLIREVLAEVLAERDADHVTTATIASAPASEYVNDRQLAPWVGVSRETLQQWRHRGEGPPYVKVGRAVRYSVAEVRAWIDARKRG